MSLPNESKKIEITKELQQQILPYADRKSLVIVNPNVAAVITERSEYGSTGGIGYYDQVRVFCGSQSEMKEWQWRDRYSASNDKPWLGVNSIGEVKVSEKDSNVIVDVELVNGKYENRTVTYTFDTPQSSSIETLSAEDQAKFISLVESEISRVIAELQRLHKLKPKMLSPYATADGYTMYRQPSIKQREFRPAIGIAAFVTEEQIDHRGSDAQIRYKLYVLTVNSKNAQPIAEDHGYEREGGAFLTIIEVRPESVVISISSKSEKKVIKMTCA